MALSAFTVLPPPPSTYRVLFTWGALCLLSHHPPPQPLAPSLPLSDLCSRPLQRLRVWNQVTFVLLCPDYLTSDSVPQALACCSACQSVLPFQGRQCFTACACHRCACHRVLVHLPSLTLGAALADLLEPLLSVVPTTCPEVEGCFGGCLYYSLPSLKSIFILFLN